MSVAHDPFVGTVHEPGTSPSRVGARRLVEAASRAVCGDDDPGKWVSMRAVGSLDEFWGETTALVNVRAVWDPLQRRQKERLTRFVELVNASSERPLK
jgi:hypothetical protein